VENAIRFNENFGTGSGKYASGEENIFLYNCLKKGLKILYLPICVASVTGQQSSWFSAWDKKLFYDKGALFYEMSHTFWFPLILQFAVHKYPRYRRNMSFFTALKTMIKGKKDYCDSQRS
ncbi:MAG: glycosyltransferase family 2 protein, partial [Clostridia bacterium]|nr:glycosyltransferase family 2 protein [Clostridia bacterium]